jgi:hypothetical protein
LHHVAIAHVYSKIEIAVDDIVVVDLDTVGPSVQRVRLLPEVLQNVLDVVDSVLLVFLASHQMAVDETKLGVVYLETKYDLY